MKQGLILFFIITFSNIGLQAQLYDEVSSGAQYSQQAYYNLSTGAVQVVSNDAWDIAFSNIGQTDAGVFINESASLSASPVKLFLAPTTDWNQPITDISIFYDSLQLYNKEANWTDGAFNEVKNPNDPFDYGWGKYNPQNHQIVGDKVYVVKKRNGEFVKLKVDSYRGGYYYFRYAQLDNSNEVIDSVARTTNGDNSIVHYSLDSKKIVNISNDYDLVFLRYITPLEDTPGVFLDYSVTGFLLAPGTQAVVADGVDVSTVKEEDYASGYSSAPTTIGHEWKSYDFTSGWIIDEDRANFVKTKNGDKYKLVFVDFSGSGTGTVTVERTKLATNKVQKSMKIVDMQCFPNPVSDVINIHVPKNEQVLVRLMNSLGQTVLSKESNSNQPIHLPANIESGIYRIIMDGRDWRATHSIVVLN